MQEFDFVIAGGGGAGLGLACALLDSPLKDRSILIVERDAKQQNDRTWCFWGGPETPFAALASHSWQKMAVCSESFQRTFDLSSQAPPGWCYWMVEGIDYYRYARQRLAGSPNVRLVQGSVEALQPDSSRVIVTIDGKAYAASWVFDSIIRPGELQIDPRRYHNLKQHFKGWKIETRAPVFDPACVTLFDFGILQKNDLRFIYILPFSETQALIEYTVFSERLLVDEEYEIGLKDFIKNRLGIGVYEIQFEEQGSIPMTDFAFTRRAGERILNIGTKGGLVKPSTGYAFKRMQQDARAIVDSLVQHGHPFNVRRSPGRYRLYDTLLLQILYRQGSSMKPIFVRLFERNPFLRIAHFLDEDATFLQDLALIATLPPGPFLKALIKVKILGRI